jgi:hypothetical protein
MAEAMGDENISILNTSADMASYNTALDTILNRATNSEFVQNTVDKLRNLSDSPEANDTATKAALNGLRSSDATMRLRAAIGVVVVNYLRETSGTAVTASEAARIYDQILNRGKGITAALNGVQAIFDKHVADAKAKLETTRNRIYASQNQQAIEIWDAQESKYLEMVERARLDPELILKMEELDRLAQLRKGQSNVVAPAAPPPPQGAPPPPGATESTTAKSALQARLAAKRGR